MIGLMEQMANPEVQTICTEDFIEGVLHQAAIKRGGNFRYDKFDTALHAAFMAASTFFNGLSLDPSLQSFVRIRRHPIHGVSPKLLESLYDLEAQHLSEPPVTRRGLSNYRADGALIIRMASQTSDPAMQAYALAADELLCRLELPRAT